MVEYLKGNFKPKREIKDSEETENNQNGSAIGSEVRKRALASLGGSMVYV